jgi:general secretion pathway protein B
MSYVLEALKKAQAQREQGGVPGIHSLQVPYVAVEGKGRSSLKPVLWAIAGLLVVILGLLAWRMGDGLGAPQDPVSPAQLATGSVPPPPAAAPLNPVLVAPARTSEPVANSLPQGESPLASPAKAELPVTKRPEKALTNAQPKDAGPKIYAVSELPDGVRRDLPTLVISGGSYSSNPAQRLIIVNNQVFTEKSEPATGLVVERIEQNAVVFSFRGYSYRVRY